MGVSASKVREEVLDAYRPLVGLVAEGLHQAFQQPEMQEEYAEAQRLFRQFDSSGDGLISCDEFVQGLKEITKQVVVKADIPAEQVQFQFQLFDTDNSGSISLDESIYLFYNLMATSRFCDGCSHILLPLEDIGYSCSACYEDCEGSSSGDTYDLCTKCLKSKSNIISDVPCPKHGIGCMQHAGDVLRSEKLAPVVLALPQLGESGSHPHLLTCMCCGEEHTIVLSYLRPKYGDLHMRPVMEINTATGEQELQGFVCEFCAMRVCSKHDYDCFWWEPSSAKPSLCTEPFNCGHRVNCPGVGDNPGLDKLEAKARVRTAAHCPTCAQKLGEGLQLWKPVAQKVAPIAATTHSDTVLRDQNSAARRSSTGPVVEACFVCQDMHYVEFMGEPVDAYLSGPHMKQLDDGRWACEFCATWICERCGKDERMPASDAIIGCWSRSYVCSGGCKKKDKGQWSFAREALYNKAEKNDMVHCKPCREKLLHHSIYDHAKVQEGIEMNRARKQAQRLENVNHGVQAFNTGAAIGTAVVSAGCTIM